jgi:hypothetical protein
MKRPVAVYGLALCLMLVATTAFAFDSTKRTYSSDSRIGILRGASEGESTMERSLLTELRHRGFDAFDVGLTYEELLDQEAVPIADYIVEINAGPTQTADYGGVDVVGGHADVSLGVVVSKVAAELRLYDGTTMELMATSDLSKRTAALMPTYVGIGGGSFYASLALPFIERAQHRNVARKAARAAASFVTASIRNSVGEK